MGFCFNLKEWKLFFVSFGGVLYVIIAFCLLMIEEMVGFFFAGDS